MKVPPPSDIQLIGTQVALRWPDGHEDYLPSEFLRAHSPSAENKGEPDLFGNIRGADPRNQFPGVEVTGWEFIGGYAIRFIFSDGHRTGLYAYPYLRALGQRYATEFENAEEN